MSRIYIMNTNESVRMCVLSDVWTDMSPMCASKRAHAIEREGGRGGREGERESAQDGVGVGGGRAARKCTKEKEHE